MQNPNLNGPVLVAATLVICATVNAVVKSMRWLRQNKTDVIDCIGALLFFATLILMLFIPQIIGGWL